MPTSAHCKSFDLEHSSIKQHLYGCFMNDSRAKCFCSIPGIFTTKGYKEMPFDSIP